MNPLLFWFSGKIRTLINIPAVCGCKKQNLRASISSPLLVIAISCCILLSTGCISSSPSEGVSDFQKNGSVTIVDSTNTSYTFPGPVERIVALNLDTIETLVVIGAGDQIVGVPETILTKTNLIPYLPNAVSVGDSSGANIEKITSLHPDVVIIMSTAGEKEKSQLKNLNIPVLSYNCFIFSDMLFSVQNLGILTGESSNASSYLDYFHAYENLIQSRISGILPEDRPLVFLEIGSEYTAAGPGSGGDSLLSNMKANNLASGLATQYPKVTAEWVIHKNPEYILKTVHTYVGEDKNFTALYEDIMGRPGFSEIDACKEGRVHVITSNILYGPKGIIGQLLLGKVLYPGLFKDYSINETLVEYEQKFGVVVGEKDVIYPPV